MGNEEHGKEDEQCAPYQPFPRTGVAPSLYADRHRDTHQSRGRSNMMDRHPTIHFSSIYRYIITPAVRNSVHIN